MEPFVLILLLIFGIPISVCALIALFSALMLLLPGPIQQARTNLEEHPWRSILLGTLNFTGAAIILALLLSLARFHWPGAQSIGLSLALLIVMAIAIPAAIGLCAAIIIISTRLGETRKPLWTYLRGGGLLLLACLTPIIGWFIFMPLVLWASIGSVIGILVQPRVPKILEHSAPTDV